MRPTRRAFADLSVGQIHYASCGDPAGTPVLLLHQSPRSWREYEAVLPLLGERWHAIAMDTAGFGDSAANGLEPSIEAYARIALELVCALGLPRVHVAGHHTGGVIALEMAASSPEHVTSVVLSATPFIDAEFRRARATRPPIDQVDRRDDGSHLTALWQRRQGFYPPGRPELLERFVRDALAVDDPETGHQAVGAYRMEERIGLVHQPVCIVRATEDPFTAASSKEFALRLPQACVVTIEGGMVPLPDQMPQAFADAVDGFLKTLPPRR
jgi:pimeloyl-ACP methyl ester carboxylesterase